MEGNTHLQLIMEVLETGRLCLNVPGVLMNVSLRNITIVEVYEVLVMKEGEFS